MGASVRIMGGKDNVMREIKVDKMIINIAVGEAGDRLTKAVRVLNQLSDQTPVENKGTQHTALPQDYLTILQHVTPCVPSASVVTRRSPHTSPSGARRPWIGSTVVSRSQTTRLASVTSVRLATLGLASMSILILGSSTTPTPAFTVWTSTLCCAAQGSVWAARSARMAVSVSTTRSPRL